MVAAACPGRECDAAAHRDDQSSSSARWIPLAPQIAGPSGRKYGRLVERCEYLRKFCLAEFKQDLSLRQLDNLLLSS
jgi:hypothetical protein